VPYPEPGQRLVLSEYGETPPDAIDNFMAIEAQPAPDPANLAPTDVVIEVRGAAVGWVDLIMSSGQYQHQVQPPYTPGLEYAGEVAWVGDQVKEVAVGDRVIADGLRTGPRSKGGHQRWGGFASYSVAPADAVIPLPDPLSFDQGANLLGNYETAYHCLIHRGRVAEGETVLIHGASGSTGLAAVHIAKLLGATVIATGRTASKLEIVKAEGADHVVDTSALPNGLADLRGAVKELTGGEGVDVVYDGVGGPISAASMRCVKFGARFLIVGWAATPFVAKGKGGRGAPNVNVLPTNLMMMKGLDVLGCPTVITTHRDPTVRTERLARIFGWVNDGKLQPRVGEVYAFDQIFEAMKAKWTSKHVGGCVVHPS